MTTFIRYDNGVSIAGYVADGLWHAVDISAFINDPSAVAVTLRVRKNGAGNVTMGVREIGSSIGPTTVGNALFYTALIPLSDGVKIEILASSTAGAFDVTGEVHDGCVIHPVGILLETAQSELDTYVTRTPTLDSGHSASDVRAVIVKVINKRDLFDKSEFSVKNSLSSNLTRFVADRAGQLFTIANVDHSGNYQTYSAGVTTAYVDFYEVGYITRDSGVFAFTDEVPLGLPSTSNQWVTADLSGFIPENADHVGVQIWIDQLVNRICFVRSVDSSETLGRIVPGGSVQHTHCAVNSDVEIQYSMSANPNIELHAIWYQIPVAGSCDAKTHMGPATKGRGHVGPSSHADSEMGPGSAAMAAVGPGADGRAMFNDACKGDAGFGVG